VTCVFPPGGEKKNKRDLAEAPVRRAYCGGEKKKKKGGWPESKKVPFGASLTPGGEEGGKIAGHLSGGRSLSSSWEKKKEVAADERADLLVRPPEGGREKRRECLKVLVVANGRKKRHYGFRPNSGEKKKTAAATANLI